jgi:hypothetical protein
MADEDHSTSAQDELSSVLEYDPSTPQVLPITDRQARSLETNRMIKIVIGDRQEPYLVAQSTLENTAMYFKKALHHHGKFGTGDRNTLTFPEDNVSAWEFLLYYMKKDVVPRLDEPTDGYMLQRVSSWILGDKYGISGFQELIMPELLRYVDAAWSGFFLSFEVLETAFAAAAPDSLLTILAAEEAAIQYANGVITSTELDVLAATPGFTAAMTDANNRRSRSESTFDYRLPTKTSPTVQYWRQFLVGDGPWRHWIDDVARVGVGS